VKGRWREANRVVRVLLAEWAAEPWMVVPRSLGPLLVSRRKSAATRQSSWDSGVLNPPRGFPDSVEGWSPAA
jgi:hypothetical protein